MQTKQKLRLGAAAVILNGLMALSVVSPRIAHAQSCPPINMCHHCFTTLAQCQALAPPGCTAITFGCVVGGCGEGISLGTCTFQAS
jgi:hypothetical protein